MYFMNWKTHRYALASMHGSANFFFWPQTCLKARILDGMHGQYIPGFYGMHECPNLGDFDVILNSHKKIEGHQAFSELFV